MLCKESGRLGCAGILSSGFLYNLLAAKQLNYAAPSSKINEQKLVRRY
jgi:hypothetical protein